MLNVGKKMKKEEKEEERRKKKKRKKRKSSVPQMTTSGKGLVSNFRRTFPLLRSR